MEEMKKKGFTLVELLAVIAILAIYTTTFKSAFLAGFKAFTIFFIAIAFGTSAKNFIAFDVFFWGFISLMNKFI